MSETYDIRQHLAVLIPSKSSKTKYHCPVCDGSSLDIHPKTGAYNCFSGNCEPKDIREAIDKLEGKPDWKPEKFVKSVRPKAHKDYFYPDRDGNRLVKVTRKDDGSGKKNFYQNHWDGGKWVSGNPDEVKKLIPIYRYAEVRQAIERNELVFIVEGESTADTLWELGIPATTTIGGAGKFSKYGDYTTDFEGGHFVLTPDRDVVGVNHIKEIAEFLGDRVARYYLAGTQGLWKKPDGGMDIADDVRDRGLTKEQILGKVISTEEYWEAISKEVDPIVEADNDPNYIEPQEERKLGYYSSFEEGLVWVHMGKNADGEPTKVNSKIGNHLAAIAVVDNPEMNQSSFQLELKTFQGHIRRVVILRSDLAGDGTAIIAMLLGLGYHFKRKMRSIALDYLFGLGRNISQNYVITESTGWVGKSFVLPHKTYGDDNLRFRDIEPSPDVLTETKGNLSDWQHHIGSKCAGNSRLIFALGVAFAAPLLNAVGMESGGFHLVGTTSQGKTTTLRIAASVAGEKRIPSWRTTSNGLEAIACAHNNILLPIDEIGQADPREVAAAAYMLGNGLSKTRMTKRLSAQKPKTWRLLFLSSGEEGMAAYLAKAGIIQKGGQEVRLSDIPAASYGSAYGCFETIHGCESSKEFAQKLESASDRYRGTPMDAYLSRLVSDRDDRFDGALAGKVFKLSGKLADGTTDHAVSRVANRFALVQVALELAHSYGILPFAIEHIEWSVKKMFDDWMSSRGGDGSIEIKQACSRIEHLIIVNEFSDRVFDPRKQDGQIVRNLLGHKISGVGNEFVELLVPTPVFDKEFCNGVDKKALTAELQSRGWLEAPGLDGRPTLQRCVNGKQSRFYVFCVNRVRDSEKVMGGMGGMGGEAENGSDRDIQVGNQPPIEKNAMGGMGGSISPEENKEVDRESEC